MHQMLEEVEYLEEEYFMGLELQYPLVVKQHQFVVLVKGKHEKMLKRKQGKV